jgi:hypothetical protein
MSAGYEGDCIMADFHFDPANNFDANLESFIQYMENEDAELGGVLWDEIARLKTIGDDRRTAARTAFNEVVKTALDNMLSAPKAGGGK